MAQNLRLDESQPSTATLLGDIIRDSQKLVRQELALARTELQEEWVKGKVAVGWLAAGIAALAMAGILTAFGVVYLLSEPIGLPTWLSFFIVAVAAGALSYFVMRKYRDTIAKVSLIPRETVQSLKENVQWIKNQT